MKQVAAIRKTSDPFVDKDIISFSWMKTCQGIRERVFAAMTAARAAEGGKLKTGDIVTVGYNASSDQIIMAALGRGRIVVKVYLEATAAEEIIGRLGWEIEHAEVPDEAPGHFMKLPRGWALQ